MKRRFLSLLMAACIVLCMFSTLGTLQSYGACFISVNDYVEPLTAQPYFSDGLAYVPHWIFTGLGLNYLYESSTALIYSSENQIFFNTETGETYDIYDNVYSAKAVLHSGNVYLPAAFVCSQFGYEYSYLSGNEYGDMVRIKSDVNALEDKHFIDASYYRMRSLYNSYYGIVTTTPSPPTPTPSETLTPTPTPPTRPPEAVVFLTFTGIPSSEILASLSVGGYKAAFFLTYIEVRENHTLVRDLVASGHSLGVYCQSNAAIEFEETAALIFEATRVKTLLITASSGYAESCAAYAEENKLIFCAPDFTAVYSEEDETLDTVAVNSAMEYASGSIIVRFDCSEETGKALTSVTGYLFSRKFNVRLIKEASPLAY